MTTLDQTHDPALTSWVGDYPDATAVFDLDSIGILTLAARLNRGVDPAGKPMGEKTRFVLATGAEPAALDFDREIRRLHEKHAAGAELELLRCRAGVDQPLGPHADPLPQEYLNHFNSAGVGAWVTATVAIGHNRAVW